MRFHHGCAPDAPNLVDGLDLARVREAVSLLHRDGDGGLVELGLLACWPADRHLLLQAAPLQALGALVDAGVGRQVELGVLRLEQPGDVGPLAEGALAVG